MSVFSYVVLLACLGSGAGFLAGLLGVGGGIIMVPGFYYIFSAMGAASSAMHMAVGTSLAVIVLSSLSSAREHYRRGAVQPDILRRLGPALVMGAMAGAYLATRIDEAALRIIFGFFMIILAVLMVTGKDGAQGCRNGASCRAGAIADVGAGSVIGVFSALLGIGGATLSVPYMTRTGLPLPQAVGTASALGFLIAVPAAAGSVFAGWNSAGIAPFSWGFVNLPAWGLTALPAVALAPLGARAAHALPVHRLRVIFALFILAVAAHMLYGALHDAG